MKCRYNQGGNPYLRISPVKEELIYENPKVITWDGKSQKFSLLINKERDVSFE